MGAVGDAQSCFLLLVLEFRPLTPAVEDDAPTRGLSIAVKGEGPPLTKTPF